MTAAVWPRGPFLRSPISSLTKPKELRQEQTQDEQDQNPGIAIGQQFHAVHFWRKGQSSCTPIPLHRSKSTCVATPKEQTASAAANRKGTCGGSGFRAERSRAAAQKAHASAASKRAEPSSGMEQAAMKSQKGLRAAEVTRVIEIGCDAGNEEHGGAVARQLLLAGARQDQG